MEEVIVIGAGIIGLSISYCLKKNNPGSFDITIIEKNKAGMEASYAAAGMLAAQSEFDQYEDFMDFCIKSRDMYMDYCDDIGNDSGVDVEFQKCGMIRPALTEEHAAHLKQNHEWQKKKGFNIDFLDGKELRELEPGISSSILCGLYSKDDGQVNNRKLMEALIMANKKLKNKIIENTEVKNYIPENNQNKKIIGIKTSDNRKLDADIVVNAAGSWSSLISKGLIPHFNVKPVMGQMASLHSDRPVLNKVIFASILGKGGYIVQRKNNELILGSTMEDVGFEKRVTEDGVSSIMEKCQTILPEIGNLRIKEKWCGFRPFAGDNLPIIGKTDVENLILATGHGRNGILLAPITAKSVEELIVNDRVIPEIKDFGVERFNNKE